MGTSSYKFTWKILMLPPTASLEQWQARATEVCSLSFSEVATYALVNNITIADAKLSDMLPYFCFLSVYPLVLLKEGYGFPSESKLTVVDDVNGNKAGWALGAIMHEINSLPWELRSRDEKQPWGLYLLSAAVGLGVGAAMAFSVSSIYSESSALPWGWRGAGMGSFTPPTSGFFTPGGSFSAAGGFGRGGGGEAGAGGQAGTPPRWYSQVGFAGSILGPRSPRSSPGSAEQEHEGSVELGTLQRHLMQQHAVDGYYQLSAEVGSPPLDTGSGSPIRIKSFEPFSYQTVASER
jgi:hypothetical protein